MWGSGRSGQTSCAGTSVCITPPNLGFSCERANAIICVADLCKKAYNMFPGGGSDVDAPAVTRSAADLWAPRFSFWVYKPSQTFHAELPSDSTVSEPKRARNWPSASTLCMHCCHTADAALPLVCARIHPWTVTTTAGQRHKETRNILTRALPNNTQH